MVELRAADLRFTSSEASDFFNQEMDLGLSADDIAGLEQRTEGWIAGLQLAALAIQTPRLAHRSVDITGFISAFTDSHRYVADYLVAEVLSRQTEPVRSFLLHTSILSRMTSELCDMLMERSDSQVMLQQLETANRFLIPLDEERKWYRYHHLFADVLQTQFRQVYPDRLPELHHRAAEWCGQNGFVSEAIHHALAAGDQPLAARLVEHHALAMLFRGDAVTVLSWIASIAPLVHQHPWLGVYQSWAFICTGQLDRLEPVLQDVEGSIELPGSVGQAEEMRIHIAAIERLPRFGAAPPGKRLTLHSKRWRVCQKATPPSAVWSFMLLARPTGRPGTWLEPDACLLRRVELTKQREISWPPFCRFPLSRFC